MTDVITPKALDELLAILSEAHDDSLSVAGRELSPVEAAMQRQAWQATISVYAAAVSTYLQPAEAAHAWAEAGKRAEEAKAQMLPDQCEGTSRGWAHRYNGYPGKRMPICSDCEATPASLGVRRPAWRNGRFTGSVPRHSRVNA